MGKVTFTVICPYNKEHKFPVVLEVKDNTQDVENTFEEYCPYCDKYVQVKIDQELKPDVEVHRRFGF